MNRLARALRGSAAVTPELPTLAFVAVASDTGFAWGLGAAGLVLALVILVRLRRGLPLNPVLGGTVGLCIAAVIVHQTGSAASGLLPDIYLDLALGCVCAVSLVVRRPVIGVVWSLARREALVWRHDPSALRGYDVATALCAGGLFTRSLVMTVLYLHGEPVAWLIATKVLVGLPVTALILTAAVAAGGHDEQRRAGTPRRVGAVCAA